MNKKLPPGNFLHTKNYEFTVEEPVLSTNNALAPSLPAKTNEKPPKPSGPKRIQSAKTIKKPLSESKSSVNSLDIHIKPNYPEPIIRGPQRPVTVNQILCEYEQQISNFSMMPLKVDLQPHILQNIQQKSMSKTGKTLDLYNKAKAKTIEEIRTREKFQGKADSAVKVWLDQLEQEQGKQAKKFNKSFEAFQKAQARLDGELQLLMLKVQQTKEKNQEAFKNLSNVASGLVEGKGDEANFSVFTLKGKPVKVPRDGGVVTSAKQYGVKVVYESNTQGKKAPVSNASDALISDDESFVNQISSPEDFEVLSQTEM